MALAQQGVDLGQHRGGKLLRPQPLHLGEQVGLQQQQPHHPLLRPGRAEVLIPQLPLPGLELGRRRQLPAGLLLAGLPCPVLAEPLHLLGKGPGRNARGGGGLVAVDLPLDGALERRHRLYRLPEEGHAPLLVGQAVLLLEGLQPVVVLARAAIQALLKGRRAEFLHKVVRILLDGLALRVVGVGELEHPDI